MPAEQVKIALLQDIPGSGIRDEFKIRLERSHLDILAFSEYYFVKPDETDTVQSGVRGGNVLDQLKRWSIELGCAIVGGSIVAEEDGSHFNRSYLLRNGGIVGYYDKIHLFANEGKGRITAGSNYRAYKIGRWNIGLLICADVLYPESFASIAALKPDLIFVPTTSPYIPGESAEQKFARDQRIFADGAAVADAIICKVSAAGSLMGRRLQGRSLIAAPGKILWRVQPEDEDKPALVIVTLDKNRDNPLLDIAIYRP